MASIEDKATFEPQAAMSLFGGLLLPAKMLSSSVRITYPADDRHEQIAPSLDTRDAFTTALSSR